jgi:deazaflavin-dependent oxidoreductase (nitroreductase family)
MSETPAEYNANIIAVFRATQGRVGGMWEETPLLLLHHTGAKSGMSHVNPTAYLGHDGRVGLEVATWADAEPPESYVVIASNGGAPNNPAWYHNLKAQPNVTIEVGTETIDVVAREATGEERDRLFRAQADRFPQLTEHQLKTDRVIPVIVLTPRWSA